MPYYIDVTEENRIMPKKEHAPIEIGQVYDAQHEPDGRVRCLYILESVPDHRGRIKVMSVNHTIQRGRIIRVSIPYLQSHIFKLRPAAIDKETAGVLAIAGRRQ